MTEPVSYGRGRLNGIDAKPGTIMGPNDYGELLVVDGAENGVTTLRLATQHDVDAAAVREPWSVTEHRLHEVWRLERALVDLDMGPAASGGAGHRGGAVPAARRAHA